MVSTPLIISKSSSPCINPLVIVPRAPTTISITVTYMFHSLFFSIHKQGWGTYPSFHFLSVLLSGQTGQKSQQFCKFSLFL